MNLYRGFHLRILDRIPRVSGDEPRNADDPLCIYQYSPRERG